jgi:hypothetical protein
MIRWSKLIKRFKQESKYKIMSRVFSCLQINVEITGMQERKTFLMMHHKKIRLIRRIFKYWNNGVKMAN